MCGICGQYNYKDNSPVQLDDIKRMTGSLVHRGPDDEGFYLSGPIGLGFRRLSIIDHAGGHQPMSDEAESVSVVFNGEIYNFIELRAELERLGHVFRSSSDTEVILAAYAEWGTACFTRFRGMWGLVILDCIENKLILCRDRLGIKPLYYGEAKGRVYFGSEAKCVLANAQVERMFGYQRADLVGLDQDGVRHALLDAARQPLRVGTKEIIAYKLHTLL